MKAVNVVEHERGKDRVVVDIADMEAVGSEVVVDWMRGRVSEVEWVRMD